MQVLSEFLNVCRVKLGMDVSTRHKLAAELIAGCNLVHPRLFRHREDRRSAQAWSAPLVPPHQLMTVDIDLLDTVRRSATASGSSIFIACSRLRRMRESDPASDPISSLVRAMKSGTSSSP